MSYKNGGGSGIRTHVRQKAEAVFKTAAIVHSAIPPQAILYLNWSLVAASFDRGIASRS